MTIEQIKNHTWYSGEVYEPQELTEIFEGRKKREEEGGGSKVIRGEEERGGGKKRRK